MKQSHNFIESDNDSEYRRVIFCTKCGKVAWYYNHGVGENMRLQDQIGDCVDTDLPREAQSQAVPETADTDSK